jgi:hypothetical protein
MTVHDATLGSPVLQVPINFTGSGDQIIVGGAAGYKVSVVQFFFIVSAAVTLIYKSGVTALTGPMPFLANGAQVQDFIQLPLTCIDADPFIINASTSVTLGGTLWYYKAPSVK